MQTFSFFVIIQTLKKSLPLDWFKFVEKESQKISLFFKDRFYFCGTRAYYYQADAIKLYAKIRLKKIYIKDTDLMSIIILNFDSYLPLPIEQIIEVFHKKQICLDMVYCRVELTEEECRRQESLPGFCHYDMSYNMLSSKKD